MDALISPQCITEHWPLSDVSLGQVFSSYPTRRVVQVFSAQGTFVVKIDEQPPPYDRAAQSAAVFDVLAAQGFPHVPALLKTTHGAAVFEIHQRQLRIFEYLSGQQPTATVATWAQLGRIARMLNAMTTFPYPYGIDTAGALAELQQQATIHPERQQFQRFIAMVEPVIHAPQYGLVHGEINLANTARRSDGTLVLIDWDEAGHGATILDAGYPLIVVFLTETLQFHWDLARAFYGEYYAGRTPTHAEKELLFRAALLHALRYMPFANQLQRWERICFAVAHQEQLLSVLP